MPKQNMRVNAIRRDILVSGAGATVSPSGGTGLDNWPSGQDGRKVDQPTDVASILWRLRSERQQIERAIRRLKEPNRLQ